MNDAISRGEILRELMEIKKEAALTAAAGRISKDVENRAVAIADLFAELVQKIPTLDVVPVVRCKDCLKYDPVFQECKYFEAIMAPNDYCSDGIWGEEECLDK